ncbi:hypothetical protein BC827DRAFT_965658 [Russula dissimulans]|nr:hypothetical protein BC827DRAFT_965658 [Russula dissimulans]
MNVRKIIESYEQDKSSTFPRPPARTVTLRPRSRPRPRSQPDMPPVSLYQRSLRTQRPSNLKLVQEEQPVTIVLKERTNGFQIEQGPLSSRLSVPLTSNISGHRSISSAELLCTLAPPSSNTPPVLSSSPHSVHPSNISARLTLQKRTCLRARRQQRYSREESALAAALRLPVEYERIVPSRPSTQYAIKQLELRVSDAKARVAELRELLLDDTTDQVTHQALLRTRWMLEHWITSAEKGLSCARTSTGRPVPPDAVVPLTRVTRQDTNLAYFFAHSPTRTSLSSTRHRFSSPIEQPRRISKHNVEPPQLRKWPLTNTLCAPMELKAFPSTSYDTNSERSVASPPLPPSPPLSPEPRQSPGIDPIPPVIQPPSPLQYVSTTSTPPAVLDIPLDDSPSRTCPGFAMIYVPTQPSDEELLAALSAELEAEPMPEYVSYLLGQLEPIGEGVVLPGLSRRGTTTSSGFEFISRPSIEIYEYPTLPRSRLLVRRSMRFPNHTRLGILSGLRSVGEDVSVPASPPSPGTQGHASPRCGVFYKVRRSMTARGQ